jgi:N-acetylmuramic acid 6-phosphate etherase
MPVRSKWQSLPTEAINPATLAIDKLSSSDIVEGMLNEDRKMLAAVQREKDRIAVGVDIITQALRKNGRIIFVGAGTSGRLGILESAEMPPTFGTSSDLVLAIMAGGKNAILKTKEGGRGQLRGRRAIDDAPQTDEEGRCHRRVGKRHDAVRARRAHPRAPGRLEDRLRHL